METNPLLAHPLSLTVGLGQEQMLGKRPLAGLQPGPSLPLKWEAGLGHEGERKKERRGHLRDKQMPSKYLTFKSPEGQTPK